LLHVVPLLLVRVSRHCRSFLVAMLLLLLLLLVLLLLCRFRGPIPLQWTI
jgi:hypothetical protein